MNEIDRSAIIASWGSLLLVAARGDWQWIMAGLFAFLIIFGVLVILFKD